MRSSSSRASSDGVVEADGGDRRRLRARPRRQRDGARRERFVEDRTRPDFVPVVILGVDPEDGDRRHVVIARHLLGELERGQRLQQREQRAAEQPGLLAGDDRDGARVGEQPRRFARARRRLPPLLLAGDDGGDLVAPAIVRLRAGDRVGPGGAVRRDRRKRTARPRGSRTRSRPRAAGSTESAAHRPGSVPKGRLKKTWKVRLS